MEREPCAAYAGAWPPALWCPAAQPVPPDVVSVVVTVATAWWLASAVSVVA